MIIKGKWWSSVLVHVFVLHHCTLQW